MIDPDILTRPGRINAALEAATDLSTYLARCEKYLAARPGIGAEALAALGRLRDAIGRIDATTRPSETEIPF